MLVYWLQLGSELPGAPALDASPVLRVPRWQPNPHGGTVPPAILRLPPPQRIAPGAF